MRPFRENIAYSDTIVTTTTSTPPLTVTELTAAIKNQLESRFPQIVVQGEISNFKPHSGGHYYFDLKDSGAKVPAVMFRGRNQGLPRMPKEGDHVTVKGALSVYPPHGKYQIVVSSMEFAGVGALLQQLEELKRKLHGLGWFDREHKKALPPFPKTIGVVTSPTGAVIRDIIHVLRRRSPGFHLRLFPVRVQGAEAAGEIARAIQAFNRHQLADVLIVGRGGGSLEDLWPFNEEIVAKAIFESQIPIISAVGHETDVTISDYVADLRAPTPSAAAEIVSAETLAYLEGLEKMRQTLTHTLSHHLRHTRERLRRYASHPLFLSPYALIGTQMQRLDELRSRLDQTIQRQLAERRTYLKGQSQALTALSPKRVLKRGYSILFEQNTQSVVVSSRSLTPGTKVRALFSDGESTLVAE